MAEARIAYPHDTDPDIFTEALSYTEGVTGFTASLIEKDYYCSLILRLLSSQATSLVFKGGTCLSKVHANLYRLSEDLDFAIPAALDMPRSQRRSEMTPVKAALSELSGSIPGISVSQEFQGHNESRQYIAVLEYPSAVIDRQERIKIEVGIREPLLLPTVLGETHTIALNPFTGGTLVSLFRLRAMALLEAYSEKVRAALTRETPAIRDLYDVHHAVTRMNLDIVDRNFLSLVRYKLDVSGNARTFDLEEAMREHRRQIEGQLRPVLRPRDFDSFNTKDAFELLARVAEAVSV